MGSIRIGLSIKLPTFLNSPFFTLCIPPAVLVLQFLAMCWLMNIGFPNLEPSRKLQAGILITIVFGLSFIALFGLGWSMRQVLYGKHKIAAALGVLLNGAYFLGFLLFFFGVFVTHASN